MPSLYVILWSNGVANGVGNTIGVGEGNGIVADGEVVDGVGNTLGVGEGLILS